MRNELTSRITKSKKTSIRKIGSAKSNMFSTIVMNGRRGLHFTRTPS